MIATLVFAMLTQAAEPPVPDWNCHDPIAQQEMNWCAARDYEVADERLNAQWAITIEVMKRRDAEWAEVGSNDTRLGYTRSLLEAQRAWLRYREAHCRVDGYIARGGTLEPLLVSTCKARLTQMRTEELKALVEVEG